MWYNGKWYERDSRFCKDEGVLTFASQSVVPFRSVAMGSIILLVGSTPISSVVG